MEGVLAPSLRKALGIVSERLSGCKGYWLIGGSCGLMLQGVSIANQPRDIDLYVDADTVEEIHARLLVYAIEQPVYSETPIYRSTLCHYDIGGHMLETVGGFTVQDSGSVYEVSVELLHDYAANIRLEDGEVSLMPLGHELLFNILRGRQDRYEAIAAVMRSNPSLHLPCLHELLLRGCWEAALVHQVNALLEG